MGGYGIIYNPDKVDRRHLERMLIKAKWAPEALLNSRWIETDRETSGAQPLTAWLNSSASRDFDTLVVAGGDGTLRVVVQTLYDAKVLEKFKIGLIPIGTGNILARNLSLPVGSTEAAAKRLVSAKEHRIDLGLADIEWTHSATALPRKLVFTGIAGIGQDARLMQNTDPASKRRIGWIAYIEGGFRSLPLKFERFELEVDGNPARTLKSYSLLVGNAGWLPGLISMMPDAKLDDGRIDLAAIGPRRIWNWIGFFSRITWQNLVVRPIKVGRLVLEATNNDKTLENMSARRIMIRPHNPALIQVDGDPQQEVVKAEFSVLPKALRMLV